MNKLMVFGVVFVLALLGLTWVIAGGNMGDDIVNKLAMLGAVATATIAIFVALKYIRQMQTDRAGGKLADENWDGIGEYKNELPFGWAVIFLGLNIWAIWYFLAGYPVNGYSQIGEYNEAVAEHDAKFEAQYANMDDATLKEMGQSVFIVQCAPCHGLQADGIDGKAANLNHRLEDVEEHINSHEIVVDMSNGMSTAKLSSPDFYMNEILIVLEALKEVFDTKLTCQNEKIAPSVEQDRSDSNGQESITSERMYR